MAALFFSAKENTGHYNEKGPIAWLNGLKILVTYCDNGLFCCLIVTLSWCASQGELGEWRRNKNSNLTDLNTVVKLFLKCPLWMEWWMSPSSQASIPATVHGVGAAVGNGVARARVLWHLLTYFLTCLLADGRHFKCKLWNFMKHLEVLRVAFPFFFFSFHLIDWLREREQVQAHVWVGGGKQRLRESQTPHWVWSRCRTPSHDLSPDQESVA